MFYSLLVALMASHSSLIILSNGLWPLGIAVLLPESPVTFLLGVYSRKNNNKKKLGRRDPSIEEIISKTHTTLDLPQGGFLVSPG